MGWETRRGRRYYYRKERGKDGRVRSVYCGGGERGELAAREDELRRSTTPASAAHDGIKAMAVTALDDQRPLCETPVPSPATTDVCHQSIGTPTPGNAARRYGRAETSRKGIYSSFTERFRNRPKR